MENKRVKNPPEIDDTFLTRIKLAQEKVEEIKSIARLSEEDRLAFAYGLAGLFEQIQKLEPSFSYAQLFDRAFDKRASESLQKKRKTLILHQHETTNSMGLTASPHKYLDIVRALDEILSEKSGTVTGYAQLRMLENSSFDTKEIDADRAILKQKQDLRSALTKCVDKVLSEVDLNKMNQWLKNATLSTKGGTGKSSEVGTFRLTEALPASMTFYEMDMFNNGIAPCVRLKELNKQLETWHAFYLDSRDFAITKDGMIDRLNHYFQDHGLFSTFDMNNFEGFPSINSNDAFVQLDNLLNSDNLALDKLPINITIRKFIDLEILFHEHRKEWLPYLLERFESSTGNGYGGVTGKCESLESEGYEVFYLGDLFGQQDMTLFCFHHPKDSSESRFVYFIMEDTEIDTLFIDPISIPLIPFEQSYLNFLYDKEFQPNKWTYQSICIEQPRHFSVQQPEQTLAYALMSNLLYSEGKNNLLNQLINDAKIKYQLLSNFISSSNKEYEEKLKAFMKS